MPDNNFEKINSNNVIKIIAVSFLVIALGIVIFVFVRNEISPEKGSSQAIKDSNEITEASQINLEIESLSQANNEFAFEILKKLSKEDEDSNIFISPVSIEMALLMTYNGAVDETKEEISKALQVQNISIDALNNESKKLMSILKREEENVKINLANSLWGRIGVEFNQDFRDVVNNYYEAKFESVDFTDTQTINIINNWIEEQTENKIKDMLNQESVNSDTFLILVNAIYFKGTWQYEFDTDQTYDSEFIKQNGESVLVKMMHQESDSYKYFEHEDFQLIELPYGDEQTAMFILLPSESKDLADMLESVNNQNWTEYVDNLEEKEGTIDIPKFKVEYGVKSLKKSLIEMGMEKAFDPISADFSNMLSTGNNDANNIWIENVLHKSFVEVNEEGTEAAAATTVIMMDTAVQEESDKFSFIADHPFFYAICDKESGIILFEGILDDPEE